MAVTQSGRLMKGLAWKTSASWRSLREAAASPWRCWPNRGMLTLHSRGKRSLRGDEGTRAAVWPGRRMSDCGRGCPGTLATASPGTYD